MQEWFETEGKEFAAKEWHERPTKTEEGKITCQEPEILEVGPSQRKAPLPKQAVSALRWIVENDSWFLETLRRLHELGRAPPELETECKIGRTLAAYDDFYLTSVEVLANRIERCSEGLTVGYPCGSYWCPKCRTRFGMRLLEQARSQVKVRYGSDEKGASENLRMATILCDIVIPDPHVVWDSSYGHLATYDASEKRRDHLDIRRYLKLWQNDWRSDAYRILDKRKIPRSILWTTVPPLRHPRVEDITIVGEKLVRLNADIVEARKRFGRAKSPPEPQTEMTHSARQAFERDEYLWTLRKCQKFSWTEAYLLSIAMLVIHREFPSITKTRFPARLKLKSSVEKVIKRERRKLYTILRDLKDVGILGAFELELIDLKHVIGGDHSRTRKAGTIRSLAGQERPQAKKESLKGKLLDEVRAEIAADRLPTENDAPQLRYAILVHMHVLVDLNGTSEADVRKWLKGEGPSKRRFSGHWKLPYQVNLKSLYQDKSLDVNLAGICHYVVKAPTALNYDLLERRSKEESARTEVVFSEEELGLLVWLQQSVGHEGLRIDLNWQQAVPSFYRAPGRRRKQHSLMKELPEEAAFRTDVIDRLEVHDRADEASLLLPSSVGKIIVPLNEFFVDPPDPPSQGSSATKLTRPDSPMENIPARGPEAPANDSQPDNPDHSLLTLRNPLKAFARSLEQEHAREASQGTSKPVEPEAKTK